MKKMYVMLITMISMLVVFGNSHVVVSAKESTTPYYGFVTYSNLPKTTCKKESLPGALNKDWAITGDYKSIAKNHCGAVAVTNLALYFNDIGYKGLKLSNKDTTFKTVHQIVKNGPKLTIASDAAKYFKQRGRRLQYKKTTGIAGIKSAIKKGRPVAILLANGLTQWHWVICVGWREYPGNEFYLQIVDGWNNSANRYYKPNTGSLWVSATEYWVD